ncbi:hypothetical protein FB451DRAFT_1361553 [Mycena latifolia]|nr:hypothetical protein FB451DRAFT_1361553 [Mycena latifolia]
MPLSSIADLGELLLCTFPQLTRCNMGSKAYREWTSKEKDDLVAFLLRHPALSALYIPAIYPTPTTRLPLDRLQQLNCAAALVPFIIAHNLHEASLDWYGRKGGVHFNVEKTIIALKSMTRTNASDCGLHIEESTAHEDAAPYAEPAILQCWYLLPQDPLMNCLPCFTRLAFLSLECLPRLHNNKFIHTLRDTEEEDHQIAQAFGDIAPPGGMPAGRGRIVRLRLPLKLRGIEGAQEQPHLWKNSETFPRTHVEKGLQVRRRLRLESRDTYITRRICANG